MKNSLNSTLAALIVASAVLGGASAAFAASGDGDYYVGAGAAPLYQSGTVARTGAAVVTPEVSSGGDGDYYAGLDRNPVDPISTGSITTGSISNGAGNSTPVVRSGGDGEYYQGLNRY